MDLFRKLTPAEQKEFRQWARENYVPGEEIKRVWHPVVQHECAQMNIKHYDAVEEDPETLTEYRYKCPICRNSFHRKHSKPREEDCPVCYSRFIEPEPIEVQPENTA